MASTASSAAPSAKSAGLLDEPGDEGDLEEQVAELSGELGAVAAVERGGRLVGLFEQIGPQIG